MSWKETWNMIVHAREIWPEPQSFEEFIFSNLFLYLFCILAFLILIAYFQILSWLYARKTEREEREYQKQQERLKWQKIAEDYYRVR